MILQKPTFDRYAKIGLIDVKTHERLSIYTYSLFTQYAQLWNSTTMAARGIVFDDNDRLIVRPLTKFFNNTEPWGKMIAGSSNAKKPVVQMKYDGSMISVSDDKEHGLVVTSKGSFTSDHAKWARQMIDEQALKFENGLTYCFELLHPENINYIVYRSSTRELRLFAVVDNDSGKEYDIYTSRFKQFLRAAIMPDDLLNDVNKIGKAEGVVANFGTYRLKYKTEEFLRLHRVIGNLTEKRVWEYLQRGEKIDRTSLEEEHLDWLDEVENRLQFECDAIDSAIIECYTETKGMTDKELAMSDIEHKKFALALRKGIDIEEKIWKMIKPKGK